MPECRALVRNVVLALAVWTLAVGGSLAWNLLDERRRAVELAAEAARASFDRDMAFRRWVSRQGGVFVPVREGRLPNPYLASHPRNQVETASGVQLALVDPGTMMREVMEEYPDLYGIPTRIVSRRPLNPANAPDDWERRALDTLEKGIAREVFEEARADGRDVLRLVGPVHTREDCLECHAGSGFRPGDPQGAVGVRLDLGPYLAAAGRVQWTFGATHGGIWLLGCIAVLVRGRLGRTALLERAAIDEELRRNRAELEARVAERTGDLSREIERRRAIETRLRAIFDTAADGIVVLDHRARITAANRAAERMFGYPERGLLGQTNAALLPEPLLASVVAAIEATRRANPGIPVEHRLTTEGHRRDGSRFPMEMAVSITPVEGGHNYTVIVTDISGRRKAELGLRSLSRAVEFSPAIVMITDPKGFIEYVNPVFTEITGYTPEEVTGGRPSRMKSGRTSEAEYLAMWDTISSGQVWHGEFHNQRKDGNEYWVSSSIAPILDETGTITNYVAIQEDITARKETEARLARTEAELRRIVESSPVCISFAGEDGTLVAANAMTEVLTGIGRDRLVGSRASDHYWDDDERRSVYAKLRATGRVRNREVRLRSGDGYRWVLLNIEPVTYQGYPTNIAWIVDITARKTAEESLVHARQEAEKANRAKSEFLSSMSHELRTPLNAILGFAQLLQTSRQHPLNERQADQVDQILKGGRHLLQLINEVLELSRVEAGRMSLSIQAVDPMPVIRECLAIAGSLAGQRGIAVHGPEAREEPEGRTVTVDAMRFKQVLLNLLSNAVKYNVEGGTIVLAYAPVATGRLRFSVTDSGPGIPADQQPLLFRPFSRLGAETSAVQGTGIGLALSKQLVELMGGEIGLTSEPGSGSTFWFEVPLAPVPPTINTP